MLKLADLCLGFDFFSELSHLRISTKTLSSSNSFALKPFFTRLSAASMPFLKCGFYLYTDICSTITVYLERLAFSGEELDVLLARPAAPGQRLEPSVECKSICLDCECVSPTSS